jgi:hypothetical protein
MQKVIRVTAGIGSNPKLWAILQSGKQSGQVGEFDLSDEPGRYDAESDGINGMSGIIWRNGSHPSDVLPRKLYHSINEWIADVSAEYPDATIIKALGSKPNWP